MKTSLVALGAAIAAFAGVAYAQQHLPPEGDPMGQATVNRSEAQAKATEQFTRLDANGDGKLDQADRAAMLGKRFDAMDSNHDGQLSREEFIAAHSQPHTMGEPGRHAMGHGPMPPMMADAAGDRAISRDEFVKSALQRFDAADSNHDGKLTPDERKAAFRGHMKAMRDHPMGEAMPPPPPPPAN